MDIIIPTYGRAHAQETLKQLNNHDITPHLVVQRREADKGLYDKCRGTYHWHVLPENITTIAPTRQWILDNVGDDPNLCMLDDDLCFYARRTDDPTKLRELQPGELQAAFRQMDRQLLTIPHVGFAAREGANRCTLQLMHNTRIMRVLGYNRTILKKEFITFGRLPVMEDFDVALRLLRAGHRNLILNHFAHNQAGSGKEGGCSHFRTKELHAECAQRLAELHPGFVRVVKKVTKGAWGGGERTDVQVSWKAAYNSSKAVL